MEIQQAIYKRVSVNNFNPQGTITDEDIRTILESATYAPSSYNLQHWFFLVITDPDEKNRLRDIAFGQKKIEDAAAAIVILGDLEAHGRAPMVAEDLISKGYLAEANKEKLIAKIKQSYSSGQSQREEAIRGASLAAMQLMLAAKALNYGTCPMINFDASALETAFDIPDHFVPVMIVAIGVEQKEERARKMRLPVEHVSCFNRFTKISQK